MAGFDGGAITSNAGALLLGATDRAIGLVRRFAACFRDARAPERIEHEVATLVGQRVFGIALGHEDLVDHDQLRHDPVLAVLAGKLEARRAGCAPLAGKSTLNRLEHAPPGEPGALPPHRPRRRGDRGAVRRPVPRRAPLGPAADHPRPRRHRRAAARAPGGPVLPRLLRRHCYLPLYVFCGRHLLAAKLRRSNIDASAGAVEEVARIVGRIRARWPRVRILLRADSGFAREALMAWCEANRVDFVFGLARNPRLVEELAIDLAWAEEEADAPASRRGASATSAGRRSTAGRAGGASSARPSGPAARRTRASSSPRSAPAEIDARTLYERVYCARGDMENRIKECQLDLFAGRASAATMRANQLRLWFASMAYVLLCALRRIGLAHTQFAEATCGTLRLALLKIGAQVRRSVRRIKVAMASAHPYQDEFALAHARLTAAGRPDDPDTASRHTPRQRRLAAATAPHRPSRRAPPRPARIARETAAAATAMTSTTRITPG